MPIDFSKPITRDSIDMEAYHAKFKLADDYLAGKFKDKKEEELAILKKLLRDKTTFAYLNMKDNEGKRIKLYPWQDLVMQDEYDRVYIRGANQIGKDFWLNVDACIDLLKDHGHAHNEAIVSDSLKQASFQMRRIKQMLYSMKIRWKEDGKFDADNMSMITVPIYKDDNKTVKYRNMLLIAPASTGLLGYDLHKENLDEFEFWKDIDQGIEHFYNQIADPRTYHTKGKIRIISNPNGVDNYGNTLENLKNPDGTKRFHTYFFDFLDDPSHSQLDLEKAKLGKTRQQIESTLLAIRSISDRNYFTTEEIARSYDKNINELSLVSKQVFMFLDVGAKRDQSCLTIGYVDYPDGEDGLPHIYAPIIHCYPVGYPLSRVVGAYSSEQDTDGWHYEKSVADWYKEFTMTGIYPTLGVDVTGNSGIVPLFNTVDIFPEDVTFSGPVKSGMYQRFKWYMEKGLLHRCKSEEFEYQAGHLIVKKSSRGYLMCHHENEDDLDDTVDSLAGLIHLCDPINNDYAPISLNIVGAKSDKKSMEQRDTKN